MGERSQIYVKVDGKLEVANYYHWNYGDRMISRARYGIEWIKGMIEHPYVMKRAYGSGFEGFRRMWDVNFDYKTITVSSDILEGYDQMLQDLHLSDLVFREQGCNDGKLFVLVNTEPRTIEYCFTENDCSNPMSAEQYMDWNVPKWRDDDYVFLSKQMKRKTFNNIKAIAKIASVMTQKELSEFMEEVR